MSFYITLFETQQHFSGSLRAEYPKVFRLRGEWEVAVVSLAATNPDSLAWVFCDVADFSYVNNLQVQIVDILDTGGNKRIRKNAKPMYVRVMKKTFTAINVDLKEKIEESNDFPFQSSSDVTCILHFRKA
jgi:hypothetical protein